MVSPRYLCAMRTIAKVNYFSKIIKWQPSINKVVAILFALERTFEKRRCVIEGCVKRRREREAEEERQAVRVEPSDCGGFIWCEREQDGDRKAEINDSNQITQYRQVREERPVRHQLHVR